MRKETWLKGEGTATWSIAFYVGISLIIQQVNLRRRLLATDLATNPRWWLAATELCLLSFFGVRMLSLVQGSQPLHICHIQFRGTQNGHGPFFLQSIETTFWLHSNVFVSPRASFVFFLGNKIGGDFFPEMVNNFLWKQTVGIGNPAYDHDSPKAAVQSCKFIRCKTTQYSRLFYALISQINQVFDRPCLLCALCGDHLRATNSALVTDIRETKFLFFVRQRKRLACSVLLARCKFICAKSLIMKHRQHHFQ